MPLSRRLIRLSWALLLLLAADTATALSMRKFNIDGGSQQLRPNAAPSTSRLLSSQETASALAKILSSGSPFSASTTVDSVQVVPSHSRPQSASTSSSGSALSAESSEESTQSFAATPLGEARPGPSASSASAGSKEVRPPESTLSAGLDHLISRIRAASQQSRAKSEASEQSSRSSALSESSESSAPASPSSSSSSSSLRSNSASLESAWPGDSLELTSQEQEKQIYESFTSPQSEPALALLPRPGDKNYVKLNARDPYNIHGSEGPSARLAFPTVQEPVRSKEGRPKFVPKVHPPVPKRPKVPERFINPKPQKAVSVEEAGTPKMSDVFGAAPPPPGAPTREPEPEPEREPAHADDHEDDHHEEAREEKTEQREQPRGEDQPKEEPRPQREEAAQPQQEQQQQESDGVSDLGKVPNLDTIHPERAASGSDDGDEDAGPHGEDHSEGDNNNNNNQQEQQAQPQQQQQEQPQPQPKQEQPQEQPAQPQQQSQQEEAPATSYKESPSQSSTEALAPAKNPLSGSDGESSGDDGPASLFGVGSAGGQDQESSVLAGQSLEDQPVEDA